MEIEILLGCGALSAGLAIVSKGDKRRDALLFAIYFKLAAIGWMLYNLIERAPDVLGVG